MSKKIIIAPDSFKGSLSSLRVCEIIKDVLCEKCPDSEILCLPIADGGEGTTDAYLNIFGGERITVPVKSPLFRDIHASYAMLPNKTAVIETAAASGLTLESKNNALLATTYGTGQLIFHAFKSGAKRIILGLGGSATTDGGAGCMTALGARFLDESGKDIPRGGIGLEKLKSIDLSAIDSELLNLHFTALCDVENPLCGKNGAAFVFARQKGASDSEIIRLDNALQNLAQVSKKYTCKDFSAEHGAGAAGGMGFAMTAFLGARLQGGADCILDAVNFEHEAASADIVITGEGKMDSQSFMGKVPFAVAKRCKDVKVIAVVGILDTSIEEVRKHGISQIFETNPNHEPFEKILLTAERDLAETVKKIKI